VTEVNRLRAESGMTLVEVLIAMLVMSIAILGIVAGLSSGILTVQRAAKASSAATLADDQMEGMRAVSFNAIGTTATPADGVYDAASTPYSATWKVIVTSTTCAATAAYCQPTRTPASTPPVAATGGTYRIDTYVRWQCVSSASTLTAGTPPTCAGGTTSRAVKQVSIVVRDNSTLKVLFQESSNFDSLTG
jgi:type IV pilus assembly protein PilV